MSWRWWWASPGCDGGKLDLLRTMRRRPRLLGGNDRRRTPRAMRGMAHTHARRTLTVVATLEEVRILDGVDVVARHPRSFDKAARIENPEHIEELVRRKRHARSLRGQTRLFQAAPDSERLLAETARRGGHMRIYLKARILPAFGKMPLDRIEREDVAAWFDAASRDRPGAANRAFEILRAMMNRAEEWGLHERGTNPCLGIAKNPRNNVARFLDMDQLARLGRALDAHEDRWPEAVAAIRLLALTGCRRSEVLDLRWRDTGEEAINLEDRPARGAARQGRAGAHRGAVRRVRPRRVPVSAPCRRPAYLDSDELLADSMRGCEARQAAPA